MTTQDGDGVQGPEFEDQEGPPQIDFSIARSRSLGPLLVLFAAVVGMVIAGIYLGSPMRVHVGVTATQPYGPADFPVIFNNDEALVGLGGGTVGDAEFLFPVSGPPFSEGMFPCMNCHEAFAPNPEPRPLEAMHADIEFDHDKEHRWCLDCHDANDRDQLHLASGTLVPLTESPRLCEQCHGLRYREWRMGIHGKRTGYWAGAKRFLTCVNCHNPHRPRFVGLKPLPPPLRPQLLRSGSRAAAVGFRPYEGGGEHG